MNSKLKIDSIETRQDNGNIFAIFACEAVQGDIRVGGNLSVPFGEGLDMTIAVDSVEVVDLTRLKIIVACEDEEEVDFLKLMVPLGVELNFIP